MAKDNDGAMGSELNLEEKLQGLNLVGEEEVELDFSEEIEELVKDVRWLAVFRVHTAKLFSHAALFNAMRIAWVAAKEVTFKSKGETCSWSKFIVSEIGIE